MDIHFRVMTATDYDQVIALWCAVEGVGLSSADAADQIARYLDRNPGLSFLAWGDDRLLGAVLCGHDGRRGFIHHLAVHPDYRLQGIGRRLVDHCLAGLRAEGIQKCHLFVFTDNTPASDFWRSIGFTRRSEISMMSIEIDGQ